MRFRFSVEAVKKMISAGGLSEDELFEVGKIHDILLSGVPSNTAMRHEFAARSAREQLEAAPIGDKMVWLLPANRWETTRRSKRARPA